MGDEIALKVAFRDSLAALGGHLDILVTAHGVQSRHPSEEFPMEDWIRVLDVNLTAVFELCQLAAKQFMAQESKGKIITVASMLSFFGGYTVPAYAASKGGVAQITKEFCNEWAEKGIYEVSDLSLTPYLVPQECGMRMDTEWLEITRHTSLDNSRTDS